MEPEIVEGGAPPGPFQSRPGRRRRVLLGLLTLAVLAVGTAVVLDQGARSRESARLAACQHSLQDASALSELRLGLLATYVEPAVRTRNGVQQLHLADLMARRAGRALPGVQRADRVCREVSIRSWHFSLVAQRTAAQAYSGALVTLLQALAAQGRTSFHDDATFVRLRVGAGAD